MIKTAGVVFDFYDDQGALLKQKLAGSALPPSIADAVVLTPEQRAALPDNVFAGVIINGEETLRKYACIDHGNTLVSSWYFLTNRDKLPPSSRVKIASNLVEACRFFDILPPPELLKEASGKVLIKGDGAEIVTPKPGVKTADLTGTRLMPITPYAPEKTKSAGAVITDPYVDTTSTKTVEDEWIPTELYALVSDDGGRSFPLQTWSQVKSAAAFFDEQGKRMHPRTRHDFCTKLAARANELGVDISENIRKYGSESYAPGRELGIAVETRRQLWRDHHDEAVSLLDGLMTKQASMSPGVFAEALAQIDILVSADRHWDRAIPDPWMSTFGFEKTAEWRWVHGNDVLSEDQLKNFVSSSHQFLKEHFGKDFVEAMEKSPVDVFESLPVTKKRVIARMAAQQEDGGLSAQIALE